MRPDLRVELPDGAVVGYAEVGDPAGSPVLYLHGSPSSRLEVGLPGFREAAVELGLRVVAPDRPGIGTSTYRRYSIASYPQLIRCFADAMRLERFGVVGVSGGGKYACACAWKLSDRVSRVALVGSTCSFDLPGARATWKAEDRRLYRIAERTPWLARIYLATVAHDLRRDPDALVSIVERSVGAADADVLALPASREWLARNAAEAFRQGGRGPAHDLTLEARAWGVPLEQVEAPARVWHGEDDRVVSPEQSRILARALPHATVHLVPGEGHFSLLARHATEILRPFLGDTIAARASGQGLALDPPGRAA